MRIFITGTGTDIGKTFISYWLCHHFHLDYWKPVETGVSEASDYRWMKAHSRHPVHPCAHQLSQPLSPHLAARLEGISLSIDSIKAAIPNVRRLLIEGAGGILVPLNNQESILDLIKSTQASVILVAPNALGTINQSLLTLDRLKREGISVLGVILNQPQAKSDSSTPYNAEAITQFSQVPILDTLAFYNDLSELKLHQPSSLLKSMIETS